MTSLIDMKLIVAVAVLGLVAAGCAVASEEVSGPGADGQPVVSATCLEGTVDCDDTPTGGDLPMDPGLDDDPIPSGFIVDDGLDIPAAIAYEGSESVAVHGFYVSTNGVAKFCEALAESFPPQCGGASLILANPEALTDLSLQEEGTTQWTNDPVSVFGHISEGEITIQTTINGSLDAEDDMEVDADIEALQIDGVWVFQHAPLAGMDALHSGVPEIIDGCLVVDDTIVVWHTDNIADAEEAVTAAKAGEQPQLLIAGGGISLDEGGDASHIPEVIAELCDTRAVWFGSRS